MGVALRTMINALGVLVGFSWEHCFDFGVTSIASRTSNGPIAKLAMAIVTMVFIVPAWRTHILFKVMILQKIEDGRKNAEIKNEEESASVPLQKSQSGDPVEGCVSGTQG